MSSKNKQKQTNYATLSHQAKLIAEDNHSKAEKYAAALIEPGTHAPVVFPSPLPGRAGAATFPLTLTLTGSSNYTILCAPDIDQPVLLNNQPAGSGGGDLASSTRPINVRYTYNSGFPVAASCARQGQVIWPTVGPTGDFNFPMGAGINYTLIPHVASSDVPEATTIDFYVDEVFNQSLNLLNGVSVTGVAVPLAAGTGQTFSFRNPRATAAIAGFERGTSLTIEAYLEVSAGTVAVSHTGNQAQVFVSKKPEWDGLLSLCERAKVVSMSAMVTYEGSTLVNQGSIAVADVDRGFGPSGIASSSWYLATSSRPFDMYRGRLASTGQHDGGGHWHYIPTDVRQLELSNIEDQGVAMPMGVFAIDGADPAQNLKLEVHIGVNFYSVDPSYKMVIQPSYSGFSPLLYILRHRVPLVSSNDSHIAKLGNLIKSAASSAIRYGYANRDDLAKLAAIVAKLAMATR